LPEVLFLSDVLAGLDTAREADMRTVRPAHPIRGPRADPVEKLAKGVSIVYLSDSV
jgi:methionine salvage enolase-phosphatase E1